MKEDAEVDEDYVAAEDSEAEGDLDDDGDSEEEEGENGWRNPLIFKGQASGGDYYYRSGYSGDYLCVPADSVREEKGGGQLTRSCVQLRSFYSQP